MTVQSVETRRSNGEDLFYVRGKEHGTDALFGWTAFRTEKEALARLDSFN